MYMGYNSGSQVKLSDYICDLNLKITDEGYGCVPLTKGGFAYMWAGAKANYGVRSGRVCFEVKIEENLPVDIKDNTDIHIVRVGWSTDAATLQLGEDKQSYGFGGTGMKSEDRKFVPYGRKFTKGDVVSCYLAIVNGWADISFAVNGQTCGSAFKLRWNRGEAFYPHILTKNCKLLVNFGMNANPYYSLLPGYKFIDSLPPELKVASVVAPARKLDCEVIMMVGLPGVGKSTWAVNYAKIHPSKKYNILGTDAIIEKMRVLGLRRQNNFGGRWDVLIKEATECFNTLLILAAKMNRNLILDQTNVYSSARRRKVKQFQDAGFVVNAMILVPTDQDMVSRSQKRTREEGKEIPVDAILDMKANYSLPDESEGLFRSITYLELQQDAAVEVVKSYNREAEGKGHRSNVSRQRSYNRNQLEKSIEEGNKTPTKINKTANKPQQSSFYSPTKPEFIPLISDRKRHDPREHHTPPEKVPRYSENTKPNNSVKEEPPVPSDHNYPASNPPSHAKVKNEYSDNWNEYDQYSTASHTEDYNSYDQQFDEYYQEKSEKGWGNKNNPPPNRPGNHGDGPNKPPNSQPHNEHVPQQPAEPYYKEENYNNNQSSDPYYKDNNAEYHNNEQQWDEGYSNQDYEGYGQEDNQTYQNEWGDQNWEKQQYAEEKQHDPNNYYGGYQDDWNHQNDKAASHEYLPQNEYQQHHMETNDRSSGQCNNQRERGRPSTDDPHARNMAPNNSGPRNLRPDFAPRGMGPPRPRFNSQMDVGPRNMPPPPRNMGPRPPNMGPTPRSIGPRPRNIAPGPRISGPRSTVPAPRNMAPGHNSFNSSPRNMGPGPREPNSRYSPSGPRNEGPPPRNMTPSPRNLAPGPRNNAPSPGPRNPPPGPRHMAPPSGPRNPTPGARHMAPPPGQRNTFQGPKNTAPGTRGRDNPPDPRISGQKDFPPDHIANAPPRNIERDFDPRNARPDIKQENFPSSDGRNMDKHFEQTNVDPYAKPHTAPDRQNRRDDIRRGEDGNYDRYYVDRPTFDDRGMPPPHEILPDNRRPLPPNQFDNRGPPPSIEGIPPRPVDRRMSQEERNFHPRDGPRPPTQNRGHPPPPDARRREEPQRRRESTESGNSISDHPDLPKLTPHEIEALKASLTQFRNKKSQEREKPPRSHDSREKERDSRPRSSSHHGSRRSREHDRSRDRHSDRRSKEHGDRRRDDRERSRRHRDDERDRSENRHKSDRDGKDRHSDRIRKEDHDKRDRRRSRSRERSHGQSRDRSHDRPPSNDRRDHEEYHEPPRKPLLDTPIENQPPPQHSDDHYGHPHDQYHEDHYDQYDDQGGYQEYPLEPPEEFPPPPRLMAPSQFLQAQGKSLGIRPPPRAVIGPRLQKERAHAANMRAQEMGAMHRMPMHNERDGRHEMNQREMAEQHLRSVERTREGDIRLPDVRGRPLNDQEVQLVQNLELKERLEQQRKREEIMKSESHTEQLLEKMPPHRDMDPGFQHRPRMSREDRPFYSPPRRGMVAPPRRGMPMRGPPRHMGPPRMPRYSGNPPHMSDRKPIGLLGEKPPEL